MMKQLARIIVLVLLGSVLAAECTAERSGTQAFAAPPNAYGLPLAAIWDRAVTAAGVDNYTAALDHCLIALDAGGSLESVYLDFTGIAGGMRRCYSFQYTQKRAGFSLRDGGEAGNTSSCVHPLAMLTPIESLPFRDIAFWGDALVIIAEGQSGSLRYEAGHSDLFLLENGTLKPLREVAYSTDRPWYTIIVSLRKAPDLVTIEDGTTVIRQTAVVPEPPGMRSSFVVFTPEELARAETAVLEENG